MINQQTVSGKPGQARGSLAAPVDLSTYPIGLIAE